MQPEEMPCLVGTVAAISLQSPSNFYKVFLVHISETTADHREKEIVVTGSFGDIQENEAYRFYGELVGHPKYGRQLRSEKYEQEEPTIANGVVAYLSGEKFPGIGKRTAEKIVELLGEDVIEKVIVGPSVLKQISGLAKPEREILAEMIRLNHGMD